MVHIKLHYIINTCFLLSLNINIFFLCVGLVSKCIKYIFFLFCLFSLLIMKNYLFSFLILSSLMSIYLVY